MNVQEVFTPNKYPDHTYVKQKGKDLEKDLERGLNTPGEITSLSGPSKSGKTVLVQNVVPDEKLIIVQGSGITSPNDLWEDVLDFFDLPKVIERYEEEGETIGASLRAGLKSWVPGLSANTEGEIQQELSEAWGETKQYDREGLRAVVDHIVSENYVILVDDFHYIERDVQEDIAEEIKEAARRGVSICVALVPHRSDDLVRANSDLRGRVQTLDVGYWDESDLVKIAEKGFNLLRIDYDEDLIGYLAEESAGSPQLMQRLCLEVCYEFDIDPQQDQEITIGANKQNAVNILESTVEYSNHKSTFEVLNSGPKTRGTERNIYNYDSGKGDVYRTILRAISTNPPEREFHYDALKQRVESECVGGKSPSGSSIIGSCAQMDELVKNSFPDERAIEWDDEKDTLYIPDPYLLFYLRWSDELDILTD